MTTNNSFRQWLPTAFDNGLWSTDDIVAFLLPLFEEVQSFHENGLVGPFGQAGALYLTNGKLDIDETRAHFPTTNVNAVKALVEKEQIGGYTVTQKLELDQDLTQADHRLTNLLVQADPDQAPERPVYLPGYTSYELLLGHHDPRTDIFCLGLILGSIVMGLDLYHTEDLQEFAAHRNNPQQFNPRVHATLCGMITEMTALDRRERPQDLGELITRLRHYRDYDPQRQLDLSTLEALKEKKPADRRDFILYKLKNRLFDTSRRNRLLYYKPNGRFVNLTVSSVPMVLHYQSIDPQTLVVWNAAFAKQVTAMRDISLNKYLRFEDHPYLAAQLSAIRQQAENDKKEFGFSQLKLAVAFLQWHNLKEFPDERINSPLLLLPVQLEKKKSLKEEHFTLKITDNEAVVNPVLAHQLKELFGLVLPATVDFDKVSMEQFYTLLQSKIDSARQGVKLQYISQPRIKLVHSIARQTIANYRKRQRPRGMGSYQQIEYSYSEDHYKPLGLELFRQKVESTASALEFLLTDTPVHPSGASHPFAAVKTKQTVELADSDNNPHTWDFDVCNIVLGNFNYQKMSLVADYERIAEQQIKHEVFEALFSNAPRVPDTTAISNDPAQWYHVVNADPTQSRAVQYSRGGKSYIIQGPPGTGKSQTITNLIADFLAQGKTVLFVCEKRAALDVVYARLQQQQLADLCSYIHDSYDDKKAFISDLRTVYEKFTAAPPDVEQARLQRKIVLEQLQHTLAALNDFHQAQRKTDSGLPTHRLIERLIALQPFLPAADQPLPAQLPPYRDWLQFGSTLTQLSAALQQNGGTALLAAHPFRNIGPALLQADNPFQLLEQQVSAALPLINQLQQVLDAQAVPVVFRAGFAQLGNLLLDAVLLQPLAQRGNLALVQTHHPAAQAFDQAFAQYSDTLSKYEQQRAANHRWRQRFERAELDTALAIAQRHEHSFFKFLSGDWRRMKKQLQQSYDFSSHQLPPAPSAVLQQLKEEYALQEALQQQQQALAKNHHTDNPAMLRVNVDVLRRKQGDAEIDWLLQQPGADALVQQLSALHGVYQQLETLLQQCLYQVHDLSLEALRADLLQLQQHAGSLRVLLPALKSFTQAPADLQQLIRQWPLLPAQAEAAMAQRSLQQLYRQQPAFAATNGHTLAQLSGAVETAYKRLLQLNGELIRAERRQQFSTRYQLSNRPMASVPADQKAAARAYAEGRKILEHEMGKTMRYKSIRELASGESGRVLKDIKPVWLMSPLSVSDSLPLDPAFFDVVIFDEASQITLEEGIPALFRAPQTIIVGDEKQMPPSNFFSSRGDDPEDLDSFDGEAEDEILSADADSLLVQGARKLPATMLRWHYRSRHESLISYSNHAFYEAGLLTVPDRSLGAPPRELLTISDPTTGDQYAPLLATGGISYHYLPGSVYESRGNMAEARYIACMLRALLRNEGAGADSIGIVAFSQEQQGVIEAAIENLAAEDKAFEAQLDKAYNRTDEGQFTGLFVKNLENVQGDERDIMILSICYGFDANKKMLMNFGPINRRGGEKRLNVIFSRAKKHMAVVASIRYEHITNVHNEGANYLRRFLQYAECVSTGDRAGARRLLDGLADVPAAPPSLTDATTIVQQLRDALQARGYQADVQVGQSRFRCALGVHAGGGHYALGILIDDEQHYNNTDLVEQYYQQPALLDSFAWKLVKVYSKDWLENADEVLARVEQALAGV